MEKNYNITQTKSASLRIEQDFTSNMLAEDTTDIHAVPYNVYNIDCVYDYNNPTEFLSMLTDYAKQKSIVLVLEEIAEDIICIKHRGNVVARYSVARKHIDIECVMMYDVMELRYGNKINTYSVLKYILKTISMYEYFDRIRKFKHSEFDVISIRTNTKQWIPGFNAFRRHINLYHILINDKVTDMRFSALLDLQTKTFTFENFVEGDDELYGGHETLTSEQIDMKIQFYTDLKNRIEYINMYLSNLQHKL